MRAARRRRASRPRACAASAENHVLVLVDGRSGSGKSTFAARLARLLDGALVHSDDIAWHHADLSGTTLQVARTAALASTDGQIGRFVDHLKATGRWDTSVLLVLADHSMDWSVPTNVISINLVLAARPDLRDAVAVAQNGGADLVTWIGDLRRKQSGLAEVAGLLRAHPGVLAVSRPAELRLGVEAGDLVATCRAGVAIL